MYGYEYIEGDLMRGIWETLSENERVDICTKLGHFHAEIGKKFTKEMAQTIGIKNDMSADLHPEVSADYKRLILDAGFPFEDFIAEIFRVMIGWVKAEGNFPFVQEVFDVFAFQL